MALKQVWDQASGDNEAALYKKHIEPAVLNRFPEADVVLLCGSQGRALSNGTHLPQKGSDFDFVLLFDELPSGVDAAMFSCQKLYIPEARREVSIDYKVFDRAALEQHIDHTVKFRRFPYLFFMIQDGHPIIDKKNQVSHFKNIAQKVLDNGPAPFSRNQLDEHIEALTRFRQKLIDQTTSQRQRFNIALEALSVLAKSNLLAEGKWTSETNRFMDHLKESSAVQYAELASGYKTAISTGDFSPLETMTVSLLDKWEAKKKETDPGYILSEPFLEDSSLSQIEKLSDINLCRIMADQYLDRLEVAHTRGEGYEMGTQSALYVTTAKALNLIDLNPKILSPTKGSVDFNSRAKDDKILEKLAEKIATKDFASCHNICNVIFQPVGGLKFDYLERIYLDDLIRRQSAQLSSPPRKNGTNPGLHL